MAYNFRGTTIQNGVIYTSGGVAIASTNLPNTNKFQTQNLNPQNVYGGGGGGSSTPKPSASGQSDLQAILAAQQAQQIILDEKNRAIAAQQLAQRQAEAQAIAGYNLWQGLKSRGEQIQSYAQPQSNISKLLQGVRPTGRSEGASINPASLKGIPQDYATNVILNPNELRGQAIVSASSVQKSEATLAQLERQLKQSETELGSRQDQASYENYYNSVYLPKFQAYQDYYNQVYVPRYSNYKKSVSGLNEANRKSMGTQLFYAGVFESLPRTQQAIQKYDVAKREQSLIAGSPLSILPKMDKEGKLYLAQELENINASGTFETKAPSEFKPLFKGQADPFAQMRIDIAKAQSQPKGEVTKVLERGWLGFTGVPAEYLAMVMTNAPNLKIGFPALPYSFEIKNPYNLPKGETRTFNAGILGTYNFNRESVRGALRGTFTMGTEAVALYPAFAIAEVGVARMGTKAALTRFDIEQDLAKLSRAEELVGGGFEARMAGIKIKPLIGKEKILNLEISGAGKLEQTGEAARAGSLAYKTTLEEVGSKAKPRINYGSVDFTESNIRQIGEKAFASDIKYAGELGGKKFVGKGNELFQPVELQPNLSLYPEGYFGKATRAKPLEQTALGTIDEKFYLQSGAIYTPPVKLSESMQRLLGSVSRFRTIKEVDYPFGTTKGVASFLTTGTKTAARVGKTIPEGKLVISREGILNWSKLEAKQSISGVKVSGEAGGKVSKFSGEGFESVSFKGAKKPSAISGKDYFKDVKQLDEVNSYLKSIGAKPVKLSDLVGEKYWAKPQSAEDFAKFLAREKRLGSKIGETSGKINIPKGSTIARAKLEPLSVGEPRQLALTGRVAKEGDISAIKLGNNYMKLEKTIGYGVQRAKGEAKLLIEKIPNPLQYTVGGLKDVRNAKIVTKYVLRQPSEIKSVEKYLKEWSKADLLAKEEKSLGGTKKAIDFFKERNPFVPQEIRYELVEGKSVRKFSPSGKKSIVLELKKGIKEEPFSNLGNIKYQIRDYGEPIKKTTSIIYKEKDLGGFVEKGISREKFMKDFDKVVKEVNKGLFPSTAPVERGEALVPITGKGETLAQIIKTEEKAIEKTISKPPIYSPKPIQAIAEEEIMAYNMAGVSPLKFAGATTQAFGTTIPRQKDFVRTQTFSTTSQLQRDAKKSLNFVGTRAMSLQQQKDKTFSGMLGGQLLVDKRVKDFVGTTGMFGSIELNAQQEKIGTVPIQATKQAEQTITRQILKPIELEMPPPVPIRPVPPTGIFLPPLPAFGGYVGSSYGFPSVGKRSKYGRGKEPTYIMRSSSILTMLGGQHDIVSTPQTRKLYAKYLRGTSMFQSFATQEEYLASAKRSNRKGFTFKIKKRKGVKRK